ncbi:MAG: peptidoglycan DD-metalloendopeptidase family protein [Patescibacteria group bacterium]|nr:peptidoglycan DD-metalloendopeptidase family protein [Patescibacteria group bacterium]
MKIPLFIKPFIVKVGLLMFIFIYILNQPNHANAGFFTDLITKVLGKQTQAAEITVPNQGITYNSQNVPLLESSVNPDFKDIKDDTSPSSKNDITFLSNDGALGVDSDLEKYVSTSKIFTYTVQKGDTLSGISNKLNVPVSTILLSNADLSKNDLLQIGQTLTILSIESKNSETSTPSKPKQKTIVKKKAEIIIPTPNKFVGNEQVADNTNDQQTQDNTQSSQTTSPKESEGYIWPFPAGIGRVSQGLHADDAYDFAAPKNTPIFAVHDGTVLIVHPTGYNGGYGRYVVVDFTDGRQAIFGHMNKVAARVGEVVKQGDIIGYVGSTGLSTGPHVHIGFHGDLGNPYTKLRVNSTGM